MLCETVRNMLFERSFLLPEAVRMRLGVDENKRMDKKQGLQPREKLLRYGAGSLSDVELLALFLRTGNRGMPVLNFARYIVDHFGSLRQLLNASFSDFDNISGIGMAKYTQLNAVAELARRYQVSKLKEEPSSLCSPKATREFLYSQLSDEQREIFLVIFLDSQNRVITWSKMFSGTLNSVEVHPREIVREAMKYSAASLILAHNHPSGKAEPSKADKLITDKIIRCCQFMDIRVLDHFVIGRGESVSFAERGWI